MSIRTSVRSLAPHCATGLALVLMATGCAVAPTAAAPALAYHLDQEPVVEPAESIPAPVAEEDTLSTPEAEQAELAAAAEEAELAAATDDPKPEIAAESSSTADDIFEALKGGEWWIQLRYRFEQVDSDFFEKDAYASTLRTMLGYETAKWYGFSALLEFLDVTIIGNDLFNSTENGVTDRPVVPDPENTQVNQAYLRWSGANELDSRLGRQIIKLDNLRWVGNVDWRQTDQTFDAVSAYWGGIDNTRLFAAYLANDNRIFGDVSPLGDARMDSFLLNGAYDIAEIATLAAYWYYFDVEDFPVFSTSTIGARFDGDTPLNEDLKALYTLEYAHQYDVENNPNDVDADYFFAELGGAHKNLTGKVGYEVLSGDADQVGNTLSAPFGTLHKFNGWADLFLVTPQAGLEDLYAHVGGPVSKGRWRAIYHTFHAEDTSDRYGDELDLEFVWPLREELLLGVKWASYNADEFAVDTQRFWVWLDLKI